MSKSLLEAFRALFRFLDYGKTWMTNRRQVTYGYAGETPGPKPITEVERSSIEPASEELVDRVFRELNNPAGLDDLPNS